MYRVIGAVNVYLLMALTGVSALEIIQLTTEYSITGDVGRWEKIKILSLHKLPPRCLLCYCPSLVFYILLLSLPNL